MWGGRASTIKFSSGSSTTSLAGFLLYPFFIEPVAKPQRNFEAPPPTVKIIAP
jgi:hypothetical protein